MSLNRVLTVSVFFLFYSIVSVFFLSYSSLEVEMSYIHLLVLNLLYSNYSKNLIAKNQIKVEISP